MTKEKIYGRLTELVGGTPLVRVNRLSAGLGAEVLAKLEYLNPGGSVKDRVALAMIEDAERRGTLRPGATIIEPTSGNTGVGLAMVAAVKGYKAVFTMPESMSEERKSLLRARGARLVLTPAKDGMRGAVEKAEELRAATPGAVILQQFDSPANRAAHEATTAKEIWDDTGGRVDIVVGGVGTGGTISGTAAGLKRLDPAVKAYAVEPDTSPMLSEGKAGPHKIQGIGANFVPGNFRREAVDGIVRVADDDAIRTARELAFREGMLVGISSGAAMWAALELARKPGNAGKRIVAILPDTGERYLTTVLYDFAGHPL